MDKHGLRKCNLPNSHYFVTLSQNYIYQTNNTNVWDHWDVRIIRTPIFLFVFVENHKNQHLWNIDPHPRWGCQFRFKNHTCWNVTIVNVSTVTREVRGIINWCLHMCGAQACIYSVVRQLGLFLWHAHPSWHQRKAHLPLPLQSSGSIAKTENCLDVFPDF